MHERLGRSLALPTETTPVFCFDRAPVYQSVRHQSLSRSVEERRLSTTACPVSSTGYPSPALAPPSNPRQRPR